MSAYQELLASATERVIRRLNGCDSDQRIRKLTKEAAADLVSETASPEWLAGIVASDHAARNVDTLDQLRWCLQFHVHWAAKTHNFARVWDDEEVDVNEVGILPAIGH